MRLIRFDKIGLNPGETRELQFTIQADELSLWNRQMQRVVEPGEFQIMVGASAEHIQLHTAVVVK